jgi:hypothetical protein
VEASKRAIASELQELGVGSRVVKTLTNSWLFSADYLLEGPKRAPQADLVVGNPPYIRLESVPRELQAIYRAACPTMRGRSDVFVGFFETGLRSLKPGGALAFICADRWMRNAYGSSLRELMTSEYSVDLLVQMHDVDAFVEDVTAYPAIVVIRRGEHLGTTVVETNETFGETAVRKLQSSYRSRARRETTPEYSMVRIPRWFEGEHPWPDLDPALIEVLRHLEQAFPSLENADTSTRVGIGVATGADEVFLTRDPELVEAGRLLPLAMGSDLVRPSASSRAMFLINPWDENRLVRLDDYPLLRAHLEANEAKLRQRYVAKKHPAQWYRTIDRVNPELLSQPKLLIPDIKATAFPILDEGNLYPHHNLYFITSKKWNLAVLGGLLISDVAHIFVEAYSVKMRGGYLRHQAQNLRRIRVPEPDDIPAETADALANAFATRDRTAASVAALRAYGLERLPSRPSAM